MDIRNEYDALFARCKAQNANKPSLSESFLDSNILQNTSDEVQKSRSTATLLQIEAALLANNPKRLEETATLQRYLNDFLAQDTRFRKLVDKLVPEKPSDDKERQLASNSFLRIQSALNILEYGNIPKNLIGDLPEEVKGMAGYSLSSALRYGACLELVNQTIAGTAVLDDEGNTKEICAVPRLGKIRSWAYDKNNQSGSLFVEDMKVDRYTFQYDNAEGIVKTNFIEQWSYDWEVKITSKGYKQAIRTSQREYLTRLQSDPNADPFVDVIQPDDPDRPALPAEAKDFLNPDSIWGRGLTGRLFAKGSDIVISSVTGTRYGMKPLADAGPAAALETVYTSIDGTDHIRDYIIEGNVVLEQDHPLRQVSDESCVDIMFALLPPDEFPQTIDDFPPTQRGWCMGRCKSPLIANSR